MVILLDGTRMTDRDSIHDYLEETLALPDYYGRNLDALYDILTARSEHTKIILSNKDNLCSYGLRVANTIRDAANNNPVVEFKEKDC